jgi:hypothetical protein
MKKLILLLVLFLTTLEVTYAQRRKAVQFDSDISVQPSAGRYGISAYDGQPYWMTSNAEWWRIETKPTHIPVWSIGSDREDTLSFHSHLVTVWFDESEVWFPPVDSIPEGWYYHFSYHGIDADTINFADVDTLDIIYFPDSVYYYNSGLQTYTATNYLSADHPEQGFRLTKHSHFQLYWIKEDERFIITRKPWSYYDY